MTDISCERCGYFPCDCSDDERIELNPSFSQKKCPFTTDGSSLAECIDRMLPDSDFEPMEPIARKQSKRPFVLYEDEEQDVPDLCAFFDEHVVPTVDRIRMCRTYASFLSAMLPKKAKK